ncbi:DUF1348 family protein [Nitrospirillum amazonense]|uniref:DUF1348 family protein n=1 Tax=Nitrospirillum amazonense TaxID=28077 RepID=UPI0024128F0C|nr:DUF1348 family protein [Nitrospirillum amazonense]MDG3439013.1 DUF1348 family protein [Nitrospirillum amazonense]
MTTHNAAPTLDPNLIERVRTAEDGWNLRDLDAVVLSHRIDCHWRSRADFLWGREQIRTFVTRKWRREIEMRTIKELWASHGARVAVRFASEFRNDSGTWFRAYGNEAWQYDETGLICRRLTSVNEHPIQEHERMLRWRLGVRPADHPSLSELGL